MNRALRVLHLEDVARDAELVRDMLEADGIVCDITRVQTREEFVASLDKGRLDLILADYSLPSFDGMSALRIAVQRSPDVPFIFVSGAFGEELAIEALKLGATDYVLKERLSRIVSAVRGALREAEHSAERKQAEQELRRSEAFLAEAQRLSHTGSWGWVLSSGKVTWSEEQYRLLGFEPGSAEPSVDLCMSVVHEHDRARVRRILEDSTRAGRPYEMDYRVVLPDGSVRHMRTVGRPTPNEAGKVDEYIGTSTDTTERVKAEEALRQREKELRDVIETIPAMAWSALPDGSRRFVNKRWTEYTGLTVEDVAGSGWRAAFHPDDIDRHAEKWHACLASGSPFENEARVRRGADGEYRWFLARAVPLRDENGNTLKYYAILTDIEDRKRAEQDLRASEARFRTFVDHATDAFTLHDKDGTIVDVNRQTCQSLGYSRDELIGMTAAAFTDATPAMRQGIRARLDAGETFSFETRHRRKDGTVFPGEVRVRPFRDGGRSFYISLSRDITERKRVEAERMKLEERLRQAEKMEAVGRLASGIAHDFNNVLGGIIAYGEMLFDEAPEGAPRKRHAQNVLTAASRGRDLVDQILTFSRSQRGKRSPTDVCRTVAEALELIRSSLPDSITLYATIPDAPLVVMGDATQLHQIVMNLCSNAIHAMKEGGALRVAIESVELRAERTLSHGTLRPGDYVSVSVEDVGSGMNKATLARIFEPFFTTKEVGRGTGLGLALVYAIVGDFGGVIDVKSVPGEGSTFSIYVPLADIPTARVATPPPEVVGR